ncbi:MAG: ABC transporter ATP-binding protein [Bacilli bacterium]|jgi:fluoroquinolone transport system ATP-binding protein|nr:ABC transporter ATP-binding protein [Acholeplasmataceae bacterium]
MSELILEIRDLFFKYRKTDDHVLKGLNFSVEKGKIVGLLGPNGAGKSTTMKILTKLLSDYKGEILYKGRNLANYDRSFYEEIGVCFETPVTFGKLTALENLKYFAGFYEKTVDLRGLLKEVNLEDAANQEVRTFSKGMKTRLNFARALLNKPQVLFLDEPTNGLDPGNAKRIKEIILDFKKAGGTVFITTHLMGDVEELCDEVIFIASGKITEKANPRDLKLKYGKKEVKVEYSEGDLLKTKTFALEGLGVNQEFLELLKGKRIETIHTGETSLNEIFILVTREGFDE